MKLCHVGGFAVLVIVGLQACGGGGGDGSGPPGPGGGGYSAPTGVTAKAISGDSIKVEWTDAASGETGYKIERSAAGAGFSQVGQVDANATSFTDAGLAPGTAADYRVKAYGADGDSAYSQVVSATTPTPPAAPTAPAAFAAGPAGEMTVPLSWGTVSAADGYRIARRQLYSGSSYTPWVIVATLDRTRTSYTDGDLCPNTTYQYRLTAFNSGGEATADQTVTAKTGVRTGRALQPTNLQVEKQNATTALFTWDRPENGHIELFNILITGLSSFYMLGDGTSLTLTDLAPGGSYTFSIRSCNGCTASGCDACSSPVSVSVEGPPAATQTLASLPAVDNRIAYSDLLPNVTNGANPTGLLGVGCNWFMNSFLGVQDFICYSSLLRFDVSGLSGKTIKSAALWLTPSSLPLSPDTHYSVNAVATPWDTSTVSGATSPNIYTEGATMVSAPTSYAPVGWDVTAIVQKWADGSWENNGFLLEDMGFAFPYATLFRNTEFYSSDAGYNVGESSKPALYVDYQ